jgi:hypothetical protein
MEALHRATIAFSEMRSVVECLLICWVGINAYLFLART